MKFLSSVPLEILRGKRVLLRTDVNVPVSHGVVTDVFRIERALETIQYLRNAGARVLVCAHRGRDPHETLRPIAEALQTLVPLSFVPSVFGAEAETAAGLMKNGDVLLFENIRSVPGEEENSSVVARRLAAYADWYVNDAFSASHRAHASIVGVPATIPAYAGLLFEREYTYLSSALMPKSPSLVILGGAKFDTKEPLIEKLLATYNQVFLGGALVNDVFKAKGFEVGRSLVSSHTPRASVLSHPRLLLPVDVLVERADGQARVRASHKVCSDEKIVDIGPDSFAQLLPYIHAATYILWNGPTGLYEAGYDDWSNAIASAVAGVTATTVVGGGDTLASITREGLEKQFSFVSTAGGAMLEFLMEGTLVGIQALEQESV